MHKVKKKERGRPRRSDSALDLHALGGRVKQLRAQTTQEEFAKFLGVSQAQLSKYELGQSAPSLEIVVKLAQKYGTTADWILSGKE